MWPMRLAVTIVLLLCTPMAAAEPGYKDSDVIEYAKTLDVTLLDASLPAQGLEDWLRRGPSRATTVRWRISDCDLKNHAGKPAVRPLCVKFTFISGDVSGWGMLTVGTAEKGITGNPRFDYAVVTTPDSLRKGE